MTGVAVAVAILAQVVAAVVVLAVLAVIDPGATGPRHARRKGVRRG